MIVEWAWTDLSNRLRQGDDGLDADFIEIYHYIFFSFSYCSSFLSLVVIFYSAVLPLFKEEGWKKWKAENDVLIINVGNNNSAPEDESDTSKKFPSFFPSPHKIIIRQIVCDDVHLITYDP